MWRKVFFSKFSKYSNKETFNQPRELKHKDVATQESVFMKNKYWQMIGQVQKTDVWQLNAGRLPGVTIHEKIRHWKLGDPQKQIPKKYSDTAVIFILLLKIQVLY